MGSAGPSLKSSCGKDGSSLKEADRFATNCHTRDPGFVTKCIGHSQDRRKVARLTLLYKATRSLTRGNLNAQTNKKFLATLKFTRNCKTETVWCIIVLYKRKKAAMAQILPFGNLFSRYRFRFRYIPKAFRV